MTANFVAKVVENLYNKVDIDKMSEGFNEIKKYQDCGRMSDEWVNKRIMEKSYFRWCQSINVLERYCRMNYDSFEETELVYKWAKNICIQRNEDYNRWRVNGGYYTFKEWLKKN